MGLAQNTFMAVYHFESSFFLFFCDRVLKCSRDWPRIPDPPASASGVLGLQIVLRRLACVSFIITKTLNGSVDHEEN
jgi:hypothetical protein